jgi:hypothetical protein
VKSNSSKSEHELEYEMSRLFLDLLYGLSLSPGESRLLHKESQYKEELCSRNKIIAL